MFGDATCILLAYRHGLRHTGLSLGVTARALGVPHVAVRRALAAA
jgi:hypothetical protein